MNEVMRKELKQAIRDIKRICRLRNDIEVIHDEIEEIRKGIISISDKLEYPCVVKVGNKSIVLVNSLLAYADSRKTSELPTYDLDDLEVTNHDNNSNTRDD